MKKYNTKALVIKSQDYKDSDKIFTFLTPELGLISAFGKGVRKITSKRRGSLDTLNYIDLKLTELPTGHKFIDEVVSLESFPNIKSSLAKSTASYALLKTALKNSAENINSSAILTILLKSLNILNTYQESDLTLNYTRIFFLQNFLKHSGFELSLTRCVKCGTKLSPNWDNIKMSFDAGGIICPNCFAGGFLISEALVKTLLLTSNEVLISLATLPASELKTYLEHLEKYAQNVLEA